MNKLHAFGDSITNLYGASDPSKGYTNIMATALGRTLVNHAVNGTCSAEGAIIAQGFVPDAGDICTVNYGINDSQRYFTSAQWEFYRGYIMEMMVSLLYPAKLLPSAMVQNVAGSWIPRNPNPSSPDPRFPWSHGYYSTTPGATITGHVSGTTVYVGASSTDWPGGLSAAFPGTQIAEVWIDGVQNPSITSDWRGSATAQNPQTNSMPYSVRYDGLAPGDHEVKIKLQSGFFYFDKLVGNDQAAGPQLWLLESSRTYQASDTQAPAPSLAFRQIVIDTAAQLTADGRDVRAFDAYSLITPAQLISDFIHWNDAGHALVGNGLLATITPPSGMQLVSAPTYMDAATGNFYIGDGANQKRIQVA